MFGDSFFKKVEKKTNVSKDTILSLANKLQDGNMKDEKTLREVVDEQVFKQMKKKVAELNREEYDRVCKGYENLAIS